MKLFYFIDLVRLEGKLQFKTLKNNLFSGFNIPVTMKPALDYKGFIVQYNSFDDVFISPKNADLFIAEILKINPEIEVLPKNRCLQIFMKNTSQ